MGNDGRYVHSSEVHEKAKLYRNVRIIGSKISANCVIADDCDIVGCQMDDYSELGRRNLIRNSTFGRGSYTGTNTIIKNANIGRYCCISWNVSIGGAQHEYHHASLYTDYWFNRTFKTDYQLSQEQPNVRIGNDVWIGANALILEGISIGDGAVIGAGAVVTKNVEPYSIVAGVPAAKIKMRFPEQIVTALRDLKWWEWPLETLKKHSELLRCDLTEEVIAKLYDVKANELSK